MSFVFYDTETTGTDTSFDQILQFAAIKTDSELNEIERFEIRSRLLPHIVPAPGAMRVTGIRASQLTNQSTLSHYEMVRLIRKKLLSWSPAVFVGYNSLGFDEHLLRQAFYKTLHTPYLTNTNGNSRSDAMCMVQAASLFSPNALTLPMGDKGQPIFKLDHVAPANGFDHESAHDALADVEATIFLCRRLLEKAPEVWSASMRFSKKATVADYISTEQIFCLSEFHYGRPYSWLVTTIGNNPERDSEFYVYNLEIAPTSLKLLSQKQLVARLKDLPKPVRKVKSNMSPTIMPQEDAPAGATGKLVGMEELEKRANYLESDRELRERLITAFEGAQKEKQLSPHVEKQIYDSFVSSEDQQLSDDFHNAPWEKRLSIVEKLEDGRLRLIGKQLIHIERPDLLSEAACQEHNRTTARRVMGLETNSPWLTLPKALQQLEDMLITANKSEATLLREHRKFLLGRMEWAKPLL